jgi:hypothetical protein
VKRKCDSIVAVAIALPAMAHHVAQGAAGTARPMNKQSNMRPISRGVSKPAIADSCPAHREAACAAEVGDCKDYAIAQYPFAASIRPEPMRLNPNDF